ncbi:MAG: amylo-alpha-1,6-glucosidase [Methanomassiliicoccales archaeon]
MIFPLKEFIDCRSKSMEDNRKIMDCWVVESSQKSLDALTLLKGKKAHLILLQNGTLDSASSGRYRTGLWCGGRRHFNSLRMYVDDTPAERLAVKYVRKPHCTYRLYEGFERLDYIPYSSPALCMHFLIGRGHRILLCVDISHGLAWPAISKSLDYSLSRRGRIATVSSEGGMTRILLPDKHAACSLDGAKLSILLEAGRKTVVIGDTSLMEEDLDFNLNKRIHGTPAKYSVLETPDFVLNKCFFWAKHDLLEFYSETEAGNGFYAGFPEFSWFFGRDGEWMSIAASMCGLQKEAESHLSMLVKYSVEGRVPHEIPILPGTDQPHKIETGYMSIDSTPLWVIAHFINSQWSGSKANVGAISQCIRFMLDCDKDGDMLVENDSTEGLIGWHESWAEARNGACVDVNAWWLSALSIYTMLTGRLQKELERGLLNYRSTFFKEGEHFLVFDSVKEEKKSDIRNASEIVPAMYWKEELMKRLLVELSGPDMQPYWGTRSMSSQSALYDRGYHTGQVWPLMTGWFCTASFKNGLFGEAMRALYTFPRLMMLASEPGRINETYNAEECRPEGQFAQGWSSALFIQSVIEGLFAIDALRNHGEAIEKSNPMLPEGWSYMRLKRVPYRGKCVDIIVDEKGKHIRHGG